MNYLLLVLILLVSGGWVVVTRTANEFLIAFIFSFLLFGFLRSKIKFASVSPRSFVLVTFLILVSFFQDGLLDDKEVAVILKMFIAALACEYYFVRRVDFLVLFVETMYFVALVSLFSFIVVLFIPTVLVPIDGEYSTAFGVGYFRSSEIARFGFYRNQSFFWEAGVFGSLIGLAYFLNEASLRNRRISYVFLATMLTTFSMGAFLIFFPLALYSMIRQRSRSFARGFLLVGVVCLLSAYYYPDLFVGILEVTFGRSFSNDASLLVRVNDLVLGLQASGGGFFLGRPSGDYDSYNELLLDEHGYTKGDEGGITNSIVWLIYKYGFPFAFIYLMVLFFAVRRYKLKNSYILFTALVGFLMIEPLSVSIFWLMLLGWKPIEQSRILSS
ncbi:hypothetical protein CEW87_21290 [Parazoarcus communis]|uniref:Uncharacterized protein n=2 Tax=Parazoarcus communis TaxID=41977 RepID=A0A2U8H6T5_9RHOO|nr:hypothetical protein CEW87_21290 [Parazoarcus communis]